MMPVYHIKKGQVWCGETIGILVLDEHIARVPGSVNHAATFSFPVRYKKVENASVNKLLKERDKALLEPFIKAARELEAEGVSAIVGGCGFMVLFQEQIANAVSIPVFLSSLLQLPVLVRSLNSNAKVGIITAHSKGLTDEHYRQAGITDQSRLIVYGLEDKPEFRSAVLEERGAVNSDLLRDEVVETAQQMVARYPNVRSILLECSELPPYSKAVQDATNLPVFDFVTLIFCVHSAMSQRNYVV